MTIKQWIFKTFYAKEYEHTQMGLMKLEGSYSFAYHDSYEIVTIRTETVENIHRNCEPVKKGMEQILQKELFRQLLPYIKYETDYDDHRNYVRTNVWTAELLLAIKRT